MAYSILFVESGASGGGSFESLYQHLRVINRQRFCPVVVYLNENHFIEPVKELGIPVYLLTDWIYSKHANRYIRGALCRIRQCFDQYAPSCYLKFVRLAHMPLVHALERIVQKENIDIIHLNVRINRDFFGLFVAERTGVVCISHLRSVRSGGFDQCQATYANRIVSAYFAVSRASKEYWETRGLQPGKIRVVYDAIPDLSVEPLDIRKTWKINNHVRFIIGCVGNLNAPKGHSFLLRAFAQFAKSQPDVILLLVGDGSLRNELLQQTLELSLQDSVVFAGYDTRAKEIIANLDLLVIPSKSEGLPRVLLEAMQVRTPVVATDVGGIPEALQHEHNGLLVNYGDEAEFSRAMERLLSDKQLCSRLVENGYRIVEERFGIEPYAAEIERIYEAVLRESHVSNG